MAFNPNIFNQFLYSPQTTGMQIGNMQGMFNPEVLLANRNNPSGRINYFGDNRANEQKKKLEEGLGSNKTINTNERPKRKDKNPPTTLEDIKKMIEEWSRGDGTKDAKDDETYGGLTGKELEKLQQDAFKQQDKLFQQSLAMGGIDKIAQGMQAGPQAFLQNVLPQMYAGQAALLSAGAANTRSLANVYSQPFVPIPKMGYYS
jgi:hypothetical protein